MSKNLASVAAAATLLALAVPAAPAVASPRPTVTIRHFHAGVDADGTVHLFGTVVCKLPPGDPAALPGHGLTRGDAYQQPVIAGERPSSGYGEERTACGGTFDMRIPEVDGRVFRPAKARVDAAVRVCADPQQATGCYYSSTEQQVLRLHRLY